MSTLAWLAHSEAERQRTLEVIRLLEKPGTVDDLGIGGIRDAFSELLFPGVSTIQSRARYFLFLPWIYREIERRAPVADAAREADRRERRLIQALIESGDEHVIGTSAGTTLKRLPSTIYWGGLYAWGIRRSNIGRDAYHRRLERLVIADPGERGEDEGSPSIWHAELPGPSEGFPVEAGLELSFEEADYLRDRIMTNHSGTLLATLVSLPVDPPDVGRPWELSDHLGSRASSEVLDRLHHARCFAEAIHGAQLLYNVMLAEAAGRPSVEASHREAFDRWADEMAAARDRFAGWMADPGAFWARVVEGNPRIRPGARRFVNDWLDLADRPDPHRLIDDRRPRDLIEHRERTMKGRLAKLNNRSALESWGGASGDEMLDYRWNPGRFQVRDITSALRASHRDDQSQVEVGS